MGRPPHDMSFSQWKRWQECPAQAYAQYVLKTYRPAKNAALAIGSLVDALLLDPSAEERVLDDFREQLFKKETSGPDKGELVVPNADQEKARAWAAHAAARPDVASLIASCQTQQSVIAQIGGATWLCILDLVRPQNKMLIDLKTTADAGGEAWCPRLNRRASFLAQWCYGYQLAIYRHAAASEWGGDPEEWQCGILCVGKTQVDGDVFDMGLSHGDAYPDVRVYQWDDMAQLTGYADYMALSMTTRQRRLNDPGKEWPPIMEMKRAPGIEDLPRCGSCDWCITHRRRLITLYTDPEPRERRNATGEW